MKSEHIQLMNQMGIEKKAFLFLINFEKTDVKIFPLPADNNKVLYNFGGEKNYQDIEIKKELIFKKELVSMAEYDAKFQKIMQNIHQGKISLINLTSPTAVESNFSLEEIFHASKAKYKLYLKDEFTVFSPEIFIKISNNTISTYPMKGTIDASIPNAEEIILNDKKEILEHKDAVNLLSEDLQKIAKNVRTERFRFISKIKNRDRELLQVSSEICGNIQNDWAKNIGSILDKLLPAGSICGFPKDESIKIIHEVENYRRNFYTGVMGIFDGKTLDSAVMIRFIEKDNGKFFYKSGGGITQNSEMKKEYDELIKKIYVPIY
ncbi:MAG: aminodeoxychorismate synthase component I [Bacteroidales bacterium]